MDVYARWGALTRVFYSTKIAIQNEAAKWQGTPVLKPDEMRLRIRRSLKGECTVTLTEHARALADEHPLCAMVLNLSYAFVEAVAREKLGACEDDELPPIEVWSQQLMDSVARDWSKVYGGKAGMVEVAVARNAVAHDFAISQRTHNRFENVKAACPWPIGTRVRLDFDRTHLYRVRLRSLLRQIHPRVG